MGRPTGERLKAQMSRLLESGAMGGVYPGATAATVYREPGAADWSFVTAAGGVLAAGERRVTPDTLFDLASVTKPFVATAVARFVDAGRLSFETTPEQVLPDARGTPVARTTVAALLGHESGLDAWGGLYLDVPHAPGSTSAHRWIVNEAMRRNGDANEGQVYSDLGYIVLGAMLSRVAGKGLDEVVQEQVIAPLGMTGRVFYPGAMPVSARHAWATDVPPTERCEWRSRVLRGEVHDENCAALGGVSGHAGLFGEARAVAALGATMLDALAGRSDFLSSETLARVFAPREGSYRLGWDTKAETESAAGKRMGPRTFGHLGFTGTSLWCDPDRELCVVLLTNRVHPTRNNTKIRGFRPAFYDAVVRVVDGR